MRWRAVSEAPVLIAISERLYAACGEGAGKSELWGWGGGIVHKHAS